MSRPEADSTLYYNKKRKYALSLFNNIKIYNHISVWLEWKVTFSSFLWNKHLKFDPKEGANPLIASHGFKLNGIMDLLLATHSFDNGKQQF